ncbi:MAG: hypothetical protein ABGZ19_04375 [Verrucomicrobiales bacterium]
MDQWIWISWENHRRTRELCKEYKIRLFEKNIHLPRFIKHPYLLIWTSLIIVQWKPKGVIVQNPSIILALWTALLKQVIRYTFVVDAHNEGVRPFSRKLNWLRYIYRYIQNKADITIVTNERLAKVVKRNGGNPFVLEDKLPVFNIVKRERLKGKYNIVCISTFAEDEPYQEVIEAARFIKYDCVIYITGNYKRLSPDLINKIPSSVILTGYIPDDRYLSLLNSADIVLDLTDKDDCLVCGAYEGVALEKPLILTDTITLKNYFYKGTVYTKNNQENITKAMSMAIENLERLSAEVKALKNELNRRWMIKRNDLITCLDAALTGKR